MPESFRGGCSFGAAGFPGLMGRPAISPARPPTESLPRKTVAALRQALGTVNGFIAAIADKAFGASGRAGLFADRLALLLAQRAQRALGARAAAVDQLE